MYSHPVFAVLATLLLASAPFAAPSVELNGVVKTISGKPLQGGCVSLARVGFTTCTDSTGAWRMSTGGTVSIGPAPLQLKIRPRVVSLEGGRLEMCFGDFTVSGRALKKIQDADNRPAKGAQPAVPASRSMEAEAIDTLLYSWNGRIITRTPLSSLVMSTAQTQALDTQSIKTDFRWNDTIKYSWLRDPRDGQMYRTLHIGTQHWMAQNINFKGPILGDSTGTCYKDSLAYCLIYGRHYSWNETFSGDTALDSAELRVCPTGWFVPSRSDWDTLMRTVGNNSRSLCSKDSWGDNSDSAGTDSSGFRVLRSLYWGREKYAGTDNYMYLWFFGYGSVWQADRQVQGMKFPVRCIEKKSMR